MTFTKEQLIEAIQKIDGNPVLRNKRYSSTYDLIYNNKTYPPILVLSVANQNENGKELFLSDFNNNIEVPFKILKEAGFEIVKKENDHQKGFEKWFKSHNKKDTGTYSSYLKSLEYLSESLYENKKINKKSIYQIDDLTLLENIYTEVLSLQRNPNAYFFRSRTPSYGTQGFYSAAVNKYIEYLKTLNMNKSKDIAIHRSFFDITEFKNDLNNSGLFFNDKFVLRFVSSLLSKPFLILTGLSGSGKTKLAQSFVQWICETDTQYTVVPVGADWTNREPLLGYPNALKPEEYAKPDSGVIDLILSANSNPNLPYFLILDEMNLSHVERYFADFLSVMESKEAIPLYDGNKVENGVPSKLEIPSNFFIIGTVNIDETTNMFSPKVLDRANTIEFRVSNEEMDYFLTNINEIKLDNLKGKGAIMAKNFIDLSSNNSLNIKDGQEINTVLLQFFIELKKVGAEFGYRSANEILKLMNQLSTLNGNITTNEKIDIAIIQKLLPKLHGSRRKLTPILERLGSFCVKGGINITKDVFESSNFDFKNENVVFPLSLEKIDRMYRGAVENGFASFAEA